MNMGTTIAVYAAIFCPPAHLPAERVIS